MEWIEQKQLTNFINSPLFARSLSKCIQSATCGTCPKDLSAVMSILSSEILAAAEQNVHRTIYGQQKEINIGRIIQL